MMFPYDKVEAQILKKEKNLLAQNLQIVYICIKKAHISNQRSDFCEHPYFLPSKAEDKLVFEWSSSKF